MNILSMVFLHGDNAEKEQKLGRKYHFKKRISSTKFYFKVRKPHFKLRKALFKRGLEIGSLNV
jgi:hypothetical protein